MILIHTLIFYLFLRVADPVIHLRHEAGHYRFSWTEGQAACEQLGFTLATRAQVQLAFKRGFDSCTCGHISSGEVVYPITDPRQGCQKDTPPGLRNCPKDPNSWNAAGWDVFCNTVPG